MTGTPHPTSLQIVHEILADHFRGKRVRIYEAGGGSASFLQRDIVDVAEITVVDIDAVQLANNRYADVKILGDIETYAFSPGSFDLIVCYNVVEHLHAPDKAIELFLQALAPGGLLLIGAPNPRSFSGWITKWTPHWFHVWYYRVILHHKLAGQPGQVPFRTVYHPIVDPIALPEFCQQRGFDVIYLKAYQDDKYQRIVAERPLVGTLVNAAVGILNTLTLGRRDLRNGDFHLIAAKPSSSS